MDLTEILAFATERLADYKVPETLEIVDRIPRNTLGKIDRQLLLQSDCKLRESCTTVQPRGQRRLSFGFA